MRSARSRNVPNENNWDAESNRKHRDDDFDEKDDENKKYLFLLIIPEEKFQGHFHILR